ncbi:MAG: hypothetical protein M1829_005263 [Trizodia sp. TS-e1964]|nr:MAG: hypothetical protein M1829_005263 [Trizodia sp. TS-e1964]
MVLEPISVQRSASPVSSGRSSPVNRQARAKANDELYKKDKSYRRYSSGVERALSLFDTALQEWADYISFLGRLLKAFHSHPPNIPVVPFKSVVAKRLAQCLNPSLPSGVHQKTLEVYSYIFTMIGKDGLSQDLPLYLPGLSSTLTFASISVRPSFLSIFEAHLLKLSSAALRPALKAIVLTLLPGLEEETSEEFERTLGLFGQLREVMRAERSNSEASSGDEYFWQCFFLATITSRSRRQGALAFLIQALPKLYESSPDLSIPVSTRTPMKLSAQAEAVILPEPGLLIRCFASGLADSQLLVQRGFLDLLVTHLPIHSSVLQSRVAPEDLELLVIAAVGVVIRKDMGLNRRLWAWLLGPGQTSAESDGSSSRTPNSVPRGVNGVELGNESDTATKTRYFESYGFHPLVKGIQSMIKFNHLVPSDRARPFRICLSLMDRWEIGGLLIPEIFLTVIESVQQYKGQVSNVDNFAEVLRSGSMFFDGVESGQIWRELVRLIASALSNGPTASSERLHYLNIVNFVITHFNVREEEMLIIHMPLATLAIMAFIEETDQPTETPSIKLLDCFDQVQNLALNLAKSLIKMIPERAFIHRSSEKEENVAKDPQISPRTRGNLEIIEMIQKFYLQDQENIEISSKPFNPIEASDLLLKSASNLAVFCLNSRLPNTQTLEYRVNLMTMLLRKVSPQTVLNKAKLFTAIRYMLESSKTVDFSCFSSVISAIITLHSREYLPIDELSKLIPLCVKHAWSFLTPSNPKFHVETVRTLWLLQSTMGHQNRSIEAALSAIMIQNDLDGTYAVRGADSGKRFAVLWNHTIHISVDYKDTPGQPTKPQNDCSGSAKDLEVMLKRPLFLLLDSIAIEGAELSIFVKEWLQTLPTLERLFHTFIKQLMLFDFLKLTPQSAEKPPLTINSFKITDDLETCFYYLETLSNILRRPSQTIWTVLTDEVATDQGHLLSNPFAQQLSTLELECPLLDKLLLSLEEPDVFIQVALLDCVSASLKIRLSRASNSIPAVPGNQRLASKETVQNTRSSLATERPKNDLPLSPSVAPPSQLIKCLIKGFSSRENRALLENWVIFLVESLPLLSDTIFQCLIPLVECLCTQITKTFADLKRLFQNSQSINAVDPESTLIALLNGLENVLASAHDRLTKDESKSLSTKAPEQTQGFFGNMVSGVFTSETHQTRSATANNRLTVLLSFQDTVRVCFKIWSWVGEPGEELSQDPTSHASFAYTSLRMRNRSRRILEHLFVAEALECLETLAEIWQKSVLGKATYSESLVFHLLYVLDGSRPKHTIPAIFDAIYSRTNPSALDPLRKSTLASDLTDTEIVAFLVEYSRSLEDDAIDEIWTDCLTFLRDVLGNPFPHRQTLPRLLEFTAILGEKIDNTNFGEHRKMRRELADLFVRLLTATFTTRPVGFTQEQITVDPINKQVEDARQSIETTQHRKGINADDIVSILTKIVPSLPKILIEPDRVLAAATSISAGVIGPTIKSKYFPDNVKAPTLELLSQLGRIPNVQKIWKRDIAEAFNDLKFFSSRITIVQTWWLPLLRQWTLLDKERIMEQLSRLSTPTTAGIVFGVGASKERLDADRKTQLTLRRIAVLILAASEDAFVIKIASIEEKLVELLGATTASSPSSSTRAEAYMVFRALVLKTSAIHLAKLWPLINAQLFSAISSVLQAEQPDSFSHLSVLQACKLLDTLLVVAPDEFQLHEWLYITDTIDAVYRPAEWSPTALVDEVAEDMGSASTSPAQHPFHAISHELSSKASSQKIPRRPLLTTESTSGVKREQLANKVLRPFFSQLSIWSFESNYSLGTADLKACEDSLLVDLFDESTIVSQ